MQGAGLGDRCLTARLAHESGQLAQDLGKPLAGDRRHHESVEIVIGGEIGPGSDDEPRPVEQVGSVVAQLVEQHLELFVGADAVPRREVEHHEQDPGSLDVTKELMAETATLARALDQAGDVGQHHLEPVVHPHHAEVRFEGGERVVGDLGLGRRHTADEGRLADVREADDGHVGHELELEAKPAFLPVFTLFGERRRPAPVTQESRVPPASFTGLGSEPAIAVMEQIGDRRPSRMVEHDGAFGHGDLEVATPGTMPVAAAAVLAVLALAMRVVAKGEQGCDIAVGDEPDGATIAAVTTIGSALGHVGLTTKGNTARATIATLDVDVALVDEIGHPERLRGFLSVGCDYSSRRTGSPTIATAHVVRS